MLTATAVALGLEKDPTRLFDRLMELYLRSEKVEDEQDRADLARAVKAGLATTT